MFIYDDFYFQLKPDVTTAFKPTNSSFHLKNDEMGAVDMHIHSKFSTDGYLEIDQIVKRCMKNGVEWASITDHNSFQAIKQLRESERNKCHKTYFDYDGVKIFTGVEVSCLMHLNRKNHLRLHVLCYGFDVDYDNILMQMLSDKCEDYTCARYYPLYLLSGKDSCYKTSIKEFKQFAKEQANKETFTGRIHLKETLEFYEWKGVPKEKILKDLGKFDFNDSTRDKIKLDVVDVINATHASGGYCVVAHPTSNFERYHKDFNKNFDLLMQSTLIANKLLSIGCDGFEIANKNDCFSNNFNNLYSKAFLRSCGTDTHFFGPNAHTEIGRYNVDVSGQNAVQELMKLETAKNLKKPTKRQLELSKIDDQDTYVRFEKERTNR